MKTVITDKLLIYNSTCAWWWICFCCPVMDKLSYAMGKICGSRYSRGFTENDGHDNYGPSELQDKK